MPHQYFNGTSHCVENVRIRSFSGSYFPALGLNTERYGVSTRIQSKCGKIRTRKPPNTDTFHAVSCTCKNCTEAMPFPIFYTKFLEIKQFVVTLH